MTGDVTWLRYVPLSRVQSYLDLGWIPDGAGPLHVPHGAYSILMEWPHPSDPVEPPKHNPDETTPSVAETAA